MSGAEWAAVFACAIYAAAADLTLRHVAEWGTDEVWPSGFWAVKVFVLNGLVFLFVFWAFDLRTSLLAQLAMTTTTFAANVDRDDLMKRLTSLPFYVAFLAPLLLALLTDDAAYLRLALVGSALLLFLTALGYDVADETTRGLHSFFYGGLASDEMEDARREVRIRIGAATVLVITVSEAAWFLLLGSNGWLVLYAFRSLVGTLCFVLMSFTYFDWSDDEG